MFFHIIWPKHWDVQPQIADTRAVQTDGPAVYPCLTAATLSRSVESYLSDIPPIQEAQAWPSLLHVE